MIAWRMYSRCSVTKQSLHWPEAYGHGHKCLETSMFCYMSRNPMNKTLNPQKWVTATPTFTGLCAGDTWWEGRPALVYRFTDSRNEWKSPSRKLNGPFGLGSDSGWEPVSGETDGSTSSAYCLMLACLAGTWIHCVRTEEKQYELHLQRPNASPHRPSLACVYPLRYILELWEMNKTQMRHC